MKRFRIVYWFNSITTERYVSAKNEEDARAKFKATVGDKEIAFIEEVKK